MQEMENIMNEYVLSHSTRKTYNVSTLKYVQEEVFSFLDWKTYLTDILPEDMKNYVSSVGSVSIQFNGDDIPSMRRTNDLVLNVSSTDCKTVHNYIWFSVIYNLLASYDAIFDSSSIIHTTCGLDRILTVKYHRMAGYESLDDYCKKMVSDSNKYLRVAFGALFVQQVYGEQAKPVLQQIIHNIKDEMIDLLQNANWLDDETKRLAVEKIVAMSYYAAYPDIMSANNYEFLQQYYVDVSNMTSYYGMRKAEAKKKFRENFKLLLDPKPVENEVWESGITEYNAFYEDAKNEFYMPAGLALPPMFWWNGPKSFNYGSIGAVIGHEITHGFDNYGRMFDKLGNLANWWTNETAKLFNSRSSCFANQYSHLPTGIPNGTLDGNMTLDELIADAGGIKAAYLAYRALIQIEGVEEPRLPGLMHLSHDQIFFIATAQPWCGTFTNARGPPVKVVKVPVRRCSPSQFCNSVHSLRNLYTVGIKKKLDQAGLELATESLQFYFLTWETL